MTVPNFQICTIVNGDIVNKSCSQGDDDIKTKYFMPETIQKITVNIKIINDLQIPNDAYLLNDISWSFDQTMFVTLGPNLPPLDKSTMWSESIERMKYVYQIPGISGKSDLEQINSIARHYVDDRVYDPDSANSLICEHIGRGTDGWAGIQVIKDTLGNDSTRCLACYAQASAVVAPLRQIGIDAVATKAYPDMDLYNGSLGDLTSTNQNNIQQTNYISCIDPDTGQEYRKKVTFNIFTPGNHFEGFYFIRKQSDKPIKGWTLYPANEINLRPPFQNLWSQVFYDTFYPDIYVSYYDCNDNPINKQIQGY